MKRYIIGVDGGGTKTHYAVFDLSGDLVGFLEGGPANHEVYSNGFEGTRNEFSISINKIFRECSIGFNDIEYGIFGIAGIDTLSERDKLAKIITELGFGNFEVMNDAFLGIKAACSHGYGICSINGTGTCCAGIDPQGSRLQIGGGGYFFGDEGGSGHLGGMAFRYVYDYLYRCGRPTLMKDMFLDFLKISRIDDLVETIYQKNFCNDWTDFSRIPFEAANLGDEAALELLEDTGRKAAKSVRGAIQRLNFTTVGEIDVVLAGSVYVKGENPALVRAFQQDIIKNVSQKISFTVLEVPPVAGAVLWAFEADGKLIDNGLRERVIRSLRTIH
jgi:N-acetylglucosamine kinase-like BadF-type ATPase